MIFQFRVVDSDFRCSHIGIIHHLFSLAGRNGVLETKKGKTSGLALLVSDNFTISDLI